MEVLPTLFLHLTYLTVTYSTQTCPPRSIITVSGGGRTANCIWEYFAVYFAAKHLAHRQIVYSQRYINDYLTPIFENVSLPIVEDIPKDCDCCRNLDFYNHNTDNTLFQPLAKTFQKTLNVTGNIVLSKCVVLVEAMAPNIREIKEVLPYKRYLVRAAKRKLKKIRKDYYRKTKISNITFVAVHVRRDDYLPLLQETKQPIAGPEFYSRSMQYFRNRSDVLGHPVFVITSDDPEWTKQHLSAPDAYICSEGEIENPGKDMVLLSSCNHAIIDYGTFGIWIGLYTEGEVILIYHGKTQFYKYLWRNPKWHFMDIETNKMVNG